MDCISCATGTPPSLDRSRPRTHGAGLALPYPSSSPNKSMWNRRVLRLGTQIVWRRVSTTVPSGICGLTFTEKTSRDVNFANAAIWPVTTPRHYFPARFIFMSRSRSNAQYLSVDEAKTKLGTVEISEEHKPKVEFSDDEWRRRLTREEFLVLRKQHTEARWKGYTDSEEEGTSVSPAEGLFCFLSTNTITRSSCSAEIRLFPDRSSL